MSEQIQASHRPGGRSFLDDRLWQSSSRSIRFHRLLRRFCSQLHQRRRGRTATNRAHWFASGGTWRAAFPFPLRRWPPPWRRRPPPRRRRPRFSPGQRSKSNRFACCSRSLHSFHLLSQNKKKSHLLGLFDWARSRVSFSFLSSSTFFREASFSCSIWQKQPQRGTIKQQWSNTLISAFQYNTACAGVWHSLWKTHEKTPRLRASWEVVFEEWLFLLNPE